ncbi:hypothetical protein N7519_008501 [Penicillium mononematosum]|uniref:uncharacterized protein n=1 Tax=Penicillium mononematosum TaxID=268346 RepID=UPI002546E140|nr:uncharacterized protein N7519_008501 [Penicillium mononematosum]KAJ6178040.1 hypothetical protein N7519_008501 [Penicillium mononematosum]
MTDSETKQAVVCVFCGSVPGNSPVHMQAARALAEEFHKHNSAAAAYNRPNGRSCSRACLTLGPESRARHHPRALVKVATVNGMRAHTEGQVGSKVAGKTAERVVDSVDAVKADGIPESEYGMTTIVADMHTRKRLMAEKVLEGGPGSGFVSLAGGFGTIEEVMEMTTWNQLGIHKVGVVLLNINGYWDGLLAWVRNAVKEGYISASNGEILAEAKDVSEVWPKLRAYQVSDGRMQLNWGEE